MQIAFIGLGNMGGGMAANQARAGHEVLAFDLSQAALDKAATAGCKPVASVAEVTSVVIQIIAFRSTGRRVFRMAPFHHHFELVGWAETTVIFRFWLLTAIACGLGVSLFYGEWLGATLGVFALAFVVGERSGLAALGALGHYIVTLSMIGIVVGAFALSFAPLFFVGKFLQ